MLALEVAKGPLRLEEENAPSEVVQSDRARATRRRRRARRIDLPAGSGVWRGLNHNGHAVLGAQPARDHVELQGADDSDDRLAAISRHVEHLHQAFFLELLQALVELLVSRVLKTDAPEMLRREPRKIQEPHR